MVVAYALPVIDDDIPNTFGEALRSSEGDQWKLAMEEEMKSLHQNQTWELVRLVAKGFAQKEGIDYNKVFSPVVNHTSIRILLALVVEYELELARLDVKTTFLHGDLEEEIYMTQPCGFKVTGKKNRVRRQLKRHNHSGSLLKDYIGDDGSLVVGSDLDKFSPRWRFVEVKQIVGCNQQLQEPNFIQKLVEEIAIKLSCIYFVVASYPVGIDSPVEHVHSLLRLDDLDVYKKEFVGWVALGRLPFEKQFMTRSPTVLKAVASLKTLKKWQRNQMDWLSFKMNAF
ncbi:hypothetical protein WN944_029618 [Citrus x changshan-huyou]|uniref:Reverse transcriptase Ty1/copia-type domain-containing protein n=1 Tax=Citrus x changshan-huyou TaxID=2935761 RepID=A0AAP0LR25_9ROSI